MLLQWIRVAKAYLPFFLALAAVINATPALAQVTESDQRAACNSESSCMQLAQYFMERAKSQPHPYQDQLGVLQVRALLVVSMYRCVGIKEVEQLGSMPFAWEQLLISAQSRIVRMKNGLSYYTSASHDDPKTVQLVAETLPYVTQALIACHSNIHR